ncbi:MAG: hypothetical protein AB1641_21500 [Thermodesulfobacteriota bacterium]
MNALFRFLQGVGLAVLTIIAMLSIIATGGGGGSGGGGGGSGGGGNNPSPEYFNAVVNDVSVNNRVFPLSSEQLNQYLLSISESGEFVFVDCSLTRSWGVGDIIVGDISNNSPYGFLRTITSRTMNANGTITYGTTQADMISVFNSADIQLTALLSQDALNDQNTILADGVRLIKQTKSSDSIAGNDVSIGRGIEMGINIHTDHVEIDGSVTFSFDLIFNMTISPLARLEKAKISLKPSAEGNVSLKIKDDILDIKIPVGVLNFTPIVFMAGPVPVVIMPKIPVYIHITSGGEIRLETGVEFSTEFGVEYINNTWRPLLNPPNWRTSFNITPGITVHAGLKQELLLLLYGVVGPGGSIEEYREFILNLANPVNSTFKEGIVAKIGGKFHLFKIQYEFDYTVFDYYRVIEVSSNNTTEGSNATNDPQFIEITGLVLDAYTNQPISGVRVSTPSYIPSSLFENLGVYTSNEGVYCLPVASTSRQISLKYSKEGYQDYILNYETDQNFPTVYLVRSNFNGLGSIGGIVKNASNNDILTNYMVKLISPDENIVLRSSSVSEPAASYLFNAIPAGSYRIQVEFPDNTFRSNEIYATVLAGMSRQAEDISVVPINPNITATIVLTWGESPHDLDSHLIDTVTNGEQVHVAYYRKEQPPYANLDVDDTNSYGPETVTITQMIDGGFTYIVHDYTNRSNSSSSALSYSSATVKVYTSNGEQRVFYVPTGKIGTSWTVFRIDEYGQIVLINAVNNSPPRPMPDSNLYNESTYWIDSLPEKQ